MTTLRALIFDVDGTLAETERDGHRVAFNQAFQSAGLDWHWSESLYGELLQVSGGKERIRFFIDQYAPNLPAVDEWEAFIAELHRRKTELYTQRLRSGKLQLRPGVRRLMTEARQADIRLAIATTSHLKNAIALLETAIAPDAPSWFEVIAAGDIVPRKKPAPDIYTFVLGALGLPAQQCLAIEDTEHGLTAATTANIATIVTVNDYTRHQNVVSAALVVNHLGEPDRPCQVLQGSLPPQGYVDIALGRSLLIQRDARSPL